MEDPRVSEMPVPWADHKDDQQQSEESVQGKSATGGGAGEVTRTLWRSPEDHKYILDSGTRSCVIEVSFETPSC